MIYEKLLCTLLCTLAYLKIAFSFLIAFIKLHLSLVHLMLIAHDLCSNLHYSICDHDEK